jgi:hypothetical protein
MGEYLAGIATQSYCGSLLAWRPRSGDGLNWSLNGLKLFGRAAPFIYFAIARVEAVV